MEEKRTHVRIGDSLIFDYKVLSEQEYAEEKEIFYEQPSGVEKVKLKYPFLPLPFSGEKLEIKSEKTNLDQILLGLLVSMNEKIEKLLRLLASQEDQSQIYSKEPCFVNISGAGMKFTTSKPLAVGTKVKLKFLLPIFPVFEITTLCEVVWSQPKNGKYEIGLKFLDIHEDDREALIFYIFKRQRKLIRSRKQ